MSSISLPQDDERPDPLVGMFLQVIGRLTRIENRLDSLVVQEPVKDWYTSGEVAEIMGVGHYTVQERWCNQGRIECEKDPDSGKWRIPGQEVDRLRKGGKPRPPKKR